MTTPDPRLPDPPPDDRPRVGSGSGPRLPFLERPAPRATLVVAAVVAFALLIVLVVFDDDERDPRKTGGRQVHAAERTAGLVRIDDRQAAKSVAGIRRDIASSSTFDGSAKVFNDAEIALYATSLDAPDYDVALLANDVGNPTVKDLIAADSDEAIVATIVKGSGYEDSLGFPAGRLGGELRCATTTDRTLPLVACFWADNSSFGIVFAFRAVAREVLARTTVTLRNASER